MPGVGAQGGSYKQIESLAKNIDGSVLINASRALVPNELSSDNAILDSLESLLES